MEKEITLVKNEIQKRFPGCKSTVLILMWDDNTTSIECRHGTNKKLYISKYYNNELTYEEIDIKFVNSCMYGEDGTIYYPKKLNK